MKIRVAFSADEADLVDRVLAFLRRIVPGCRVKGPSGQDGKLVVFITK